MGHVHEEVLLRMKTMESLLYDKLEELQYGVDNLDATCYTLRMYAEWMMDTVGFSPLTYSELAKLKDSFLTFEVLLTLDDEDVTEYVSDNLYLQAREFHRAVGKLIVSLEELL